jgi:hypothetical protein
MTAPATTSTMSLPSLPPELLELAAGLAAAGEAVDVGVSVGVASVPTSTPPVTGLAVLLTVCVAFARGVGL